MITFFKGLTAASLALAITALAPSASAASDSIRHSDELPPARSSNEPLPPTPSLTNQSATLVRQAGIGGPTSYGRNGVLELGGSFNLTHAASQTTVALSPSIGWFFTDNFELSGIISMAFNRSKATIDGASQDIRSLFLTGLVEPSVHVPIIDNLFLFGGWGFGAAYSQQTQKAGFAMAPRFGVNLLVGRSGILTPSVTWNWASNEVVKLSDGRGTAVAVNSTWGANVGYTVMW